MVPSPKCILWLAAGPHSVCSQSQIPRCTSQKRLYQRVPNIQGQRHGGVCFTHSLCFIPVIFITNINTPIIHKLLKLPQLNLSETIKHAHSTIFPHVLTVIRSIFFRDYFTKLVPWLYMLHPTNIFTSSPSSTPCDRCQWSKILFWNYFNLTSAEKARSRKYIQILVNPFSVSSKPFIWVGLLFGNYLILLKAPPPSTTSLKESSVLKKKKIVFETHPLTTLWNYVREWVSRGHL